MAEEINRLSESPGFGSVTDAVLPWQSAADSTKFGNATPAQIAGSASGALLTESGTGAKISALDAKATPDAADELVIIDNEATPPVNKRIAIGNLPGGVGVVEWGDIGGDLGDQTDLVSALGNKADASAIANMVTAASNLTDARLVAGSGGAKGVAATSIDPASVVTAESNLTNDAVVLGNGAKGAKAGILQSAITTKTQAPTEVAGTTYEVTDADTGRVLYFTNAGGCVVTLDDQASPGVGCLLIPSPAAGDVDLIEDDASTIINPEGSALTIDPDGVATAYCEANPTTGEAVWRIGGEVAAT
jgi:hypothetical protein